MLPLKAKYKNMKNNLQITITRKSDKKSWLTKYLQGTKSNQIWVILTLP